MVALNGAFREGEELKLFTNLHSVQTAEMPSLSCGIADCGNRHTIRIFLNLNCLFLSQIAFYDETEF